MCKKYGKLDENWPKMLHDGFRECMRVLKPDGVLIFKWSEAQIPANDVLLSITEKSGIGGHACAKIYLPSAAGTNRTWWIAR